MNNFWECVYEQNKVKEQLNKIFISRRVPHAFIFSGPEGVGKFNTAIQFAKIINQESQKAISTLYQRIDELQEPYIKLVLPLPRGKNEKSEDSDLDKLSKDTLEEVKNEIKKKTKNFYYKITIDNANTIKISSIREIKKFISLSEDKQINRFVIITNAEMMNDEAQNALLKSLEEPPERVTFILTTARKEKLLPTIISRCREIVFEPLTNSTVEKILIDKFAIDVKTANKVARYSEGSIVQAIKLINYDIEVIQTKAISILRYSFARKYQAALTEIVEFSKNNSDDSIIVLIKIIKIWLADVLRHRKSINKFVFEEAYETIEKFNSKFSESNIEKPFSNIELLEHSLSRNINLNVLFLNIIFELASVVKRN